MVRLAFAWDGGAALCAGAAAGAVAAGATVLIKEAILLGKGA
jgi:hypothetical protein